MMDVIAQVQSSPERSDEHGEFSQPSALDSTSQSNLDMITSSDDHGSTSGVGENSITLLNQDELLPVYAQGQTKGVVSKRVVKILLEPNEESVAKVVPTSVSMNAVFVVDVSSPHVKHIKNILADDLGAWNPTGTKQQFYKMDTNASTVTKISQEAFLDANDQHVYRSTRSFYRNISSPDLRRIVSYLTDSMGQIHKLVFVQYIFDGKEHEINVQPHGNSKKEAGYFRTSHTIKERIKEFTRQGKSPEAAFQEIMGGGGSVEKPSPASQPRNVQQLRNFKKSMLQKTDDHKFELIAMVKEEAKDENSAFLRKVDISSDLCVVLATNHQLNDVARFCTNPAKFSVFGVERSFDLGKFYVTVTTYRHLLLRTKQGVHPVRIGPVLLHKKKKASSYHELSSTMVKLYPDTQNILVYSTDEEVALREGFGRSLLHAQHFPCDFHMRGKIQSKLLELGIEDDIADVVLRDIFGGEYVGSERIPGVVDAGSLDDLNTAIGNLKLKWASLHSEGVQFSTYFVENMLELLKKSLTADKRFLKLCGLSLLPVMYDQNSSAIISSIVQSEAQLDSNRTCMTMPEFVRHLQRVIQQQRQEEEVALTGVGGHLQLDWEYRDYGMKDTDFKKKTKDQKDAILKQFHDAPLRIQEALPTDLREKFSGNHVPSLSIRLQDFGIVNVPFSTVASMYYSACVLLQTKHENIIRAPGRGDDLPRYVANETANAPAYVVSRKLTAHLGVYYECDPRCTRFTTYAICAHIIAVAEVDGQLAAFVRCYRTRNVNPVVDPLVFLDIPAARGQKRTESTSFSYQDVRKRRVERLESYTRQSETL